ncbi:MAG: Ldh family oxidoreductase, partial [Pseudomonadota bacterium]
MRTNQEDLTRFCHRLLDAAGIDEAQAKALTENLVWCDMVGRRNHGIERLPILLKHFAATTIKCPSMPRFQSLSDT